MTSIQEAFGLYREYKKACNSSKVDKAQCADLLKQLKRKFIQFDSFLPGVDTSMEEISKTTKQEILLVRQTLELATLFSVRQHDIKSFEKHFPQLKSYYTDYDDIIPESEIKLKILGLNLLRLLAQNDISAFHSELELIDIEKHVNIYIRHPIQLETYIMEGAYNKIATLRQSVPADEYSYFMDVLTTTVRDEIAECCQKSYQELSVSGASELLMLYNDKETLEYAKKIGWKVENNKFKFEKDNQQEQFVKAPQFIVNALGYAKQFEQII